MRLLDRHVLAGLVLPIGHEGFVIGFVELAGRIVADIQQRGPGEAPATANRPSTDSIDRCGDDCRDGNVRVKALS